MTTPEQPTTSLWSSVKSAIRVGVQKRRDALWAGHMWHEVTFTASGTTGRHDWARPVRLLSCPVCHALVVDLPNDRDAHADWHLDGPQR